MDRISNMISGWEEVLKTSDSELYQKVKADFENCGLLTQSEYVNHSACVRETGKLDLSGTYYLYVHR
ncbi:MAG: hypothetical protein ACK5ML_05910 [Lachnospiraceae bacterium]